MCSSAYKGVKCTLDKCEKNHPPGFCDEDACEGRRLPSCLNWHTHRKPSNKARNEAKTMGKPSNNIAKPNKFAKGKKGNSTGRPSPPSHTNSKGTDQEKSKAKPKAATLRDLQRELKTAKSKLAKFSNPSTVHPGRSYASVASPYPMPPPQPQPQQPRQPLLPPMQQNMVFAEALANLTAMARAMGIPA